MRENERIDMEATEAYKPLPGDLKKVGGTAAERKERRGKCDMGKNFTS